MTISSFLSFLSNSEPEKIIISGFDLTEFGVSAGPDRSGHTTMGRFLTDEGTGRMERLICSSLPAQPPAIEERAAECNSNRKKATSVVVEVRSVRSLDADRIARDFREK